VGVGVDSNLKI